MKLLKRLMLSLLLCGSATSWAQTDFSTRAIQSMENGIAVNEALVSFFLAHPCEVGMKNDCDRPLSSRDIGILKKLFGQLDTWNKEVFGSIIPASDRLKGLPFELAAGAGFSMQEETRFNRRLLKQEKFLRIVLGPTDEQSQQFLTDVQISAASTLLMYDSFFKLSQVLAHAKKIRSILEYDLGGDARILKETFAFALDQQIWKSTENNLQLLQEVPTAQFQINYFEQYISKSFTASKIKDQDFVFRMKNVLFIERILSQTHFLNVIDRIIGKLSQIFGNTAGQVQTRDGKLKALASDPVAMKYLKGKLKPLDLLLEKTPFRLTDQFIPGFFGHVAIWLGQPEEILQYKVQYQGLEILLIDHPTVQPYLEQMSLGRLVVEALREPGVTVNSLEHFMDIDDFLVLRHSQLEASGEKILRTIQQIGKPYDFNFDVETESSIVCSELVYTVFNDQPWPTSQSLGRHTIGPDHVAWRAIDTCYTPIVMFHDGKEIKKNMLTELKRLLEQRGGISYTPIGRCL